MISSDPKRCNKKRDGRHLPRSTQRSKYQKDLNPPDDDWYWYDDDDYWKQCRCDDCLGFGFHSYGDGTRNENAHGNWVMIFTEAGNKYYSHINQLTALDFKRLNISKENVVEQLTSEDEALRRVAKHFWKRFRNNGI